MTFKLTPEKPPYYESTALNNPTYTNIKTLEATITQTATNAPVLTILQNTYNGTWTPTRVTNGTYRLTLNTTELTLTKTVVYIQPTQESIVTAIYKESTSQIGITTNQLVIDGTDITIAPQDGVLSNHSIKIQTYV